MWRTTCYQRFIQICIFYTQNKLSTWEIWCVPLIVLTVKSNAMVRRPKSKSFVILSCRYDKQESIEWNFLNLCRTLLSGKKFIVWSWIICPIILEISSSSKMGMKFFGSVILKLNFCNFGFIWEGGEFDEKIANFSHKCTKFIWAVF